MSEYAKEAAAAALEEASGENIQHRVDVPPPGGGRLDSVIRAGSKLSAVAGTLAALMLFALIGVVLLGIIGRTLRLTTFGWAYEISGYLLAGIVFMGAAYAALTDGLIRVELLTHRLGDKATGVLRLVASAFALVFGAVLLVLLWRYHSYTRDRHLHSESLLETPLSIPQSVLVIGGTLLLLELLRQFVQRARTLRADFGSSPKEKP